MSFHDWAWFGRVLSKNGVILFMNKQVNAWRTKSLYNLRFTSWVLTPTPLKKEPCALYTVGAHTPIFSKKEPWAQYIVGVHTLSLYLIMDFDWYRRSKNSHTVYVNKAKSSQLL